MRPSAEKVLAALDRLDGRPRIVYQTGNTIAQLSLATGLSRHVIRARLQDLRRLGLVESGLCRILQGESTQNLYGHYLTGEGMRRAQTR